MEAQTAPLSIVKTKIVATVGPASANRAVIRDLVVAGVDLFRLNFAHGTHEWLGEVLANIRDVEDELERPVGVLADLSGPKIRLGELPGDELECPDNAEFRFVQTARGSANELTCSYERLVNDVSPGDRILLADGTVAMRVTAVDDESATCRVEQPGRIRSRQGVNLPGVALSTPSLTEKDRSDLNWALDHEVDFVGLSFVRSADDVMLLREAIEHRNAKTTPLIVSKIEKTEAVEDLSRILDVTDAVMVARGDLGVEADITRVPVLQKQIIARCNQRRVPVITATQMLDSMQHNELPTRAEATDVANAVLDGTDAVMLSGETAIGAHPARCVRMMDQIARNAEELVRSGPQVDTGNDPNRHALPVTEAVAAGAVEAAEQLNAKMIVVASQTGRTAMAFSKQRCRVPIVAVSGRVSTARRMCLYWGVTSLHSDAATSSPDELIQRVNGWGRQHNLLADGDRIVLVGRTNWSGYGHDIMVIHTLE